MVSAITGAALSGLQSAEKRIQHSAEAIAANGAKASFEIQQKSASVSAAESTPQTLPQVGLAENGVGATDSATKQRTVPEFDPNKIGGQGAASQTNQPNLTTENALLQQKIATYDYKANLKTLKAADNITKNLLDIVS